MSESELQAAVIELARRLGYRTAHFRPGMTQTGRWVTAVQGDGKGFPDLVLARPGRLLFVELKADGKYPSSEQRAWLEVLGTTTWAYVWRPKDWLDGTVDMVLRDYEEKAA